uniref:Carboxylic ester hydrolase n=1 Tax=Plectus sambesii TaxID=2011161 RepID=A0A914WE99_9BILA
MLRFAIILLLLAILSVSEGQQDKDWTKLTLSTGAIRGRKLVTKKNTTAYLFHGIPYAEPPVGELRFRPPVNKKKWEGEMKTDDYNAACMSTGELEWGQANQNKMSEDCLHVNVFTTEKCLRDKKCPVAYYIFGGAWNFGNPFNLPDWMLADNFQSKDIVMITSTYRMGFFGFFNSGKQSSAAKNMGIMDMILGLQWTQREIHNFGGDKNRVSIMGHSSGGHATDLLSLSPKTKGLFHQVIPMSGPAGMMPVLEDNNVAQSRQLAVAAGCATEDQWNAGSSFEDIIACMRSKSAEELVDFQRELEMKGSEFTGPVMDGANGVFPGSLEELLSNRRPYGMLIGTTNREFRTSKFLVDEDGNFNEQLLSLGCVLMAKSRGFKSATAVGQACFDEYSKRPMDIADLFDDIMIYLPTYDSGEAMRHKGATVYKYSFEYDKIGDAFEVGAKAADKESPFHAEDLVYVMGLGYGKFTPKDEKIQVLYGGMFADFIKTGNPSPPNIDPWQPTDDRNNYFLINFDDDNNMPGNTNGYHAKAVQFWTKTALKIDQSSSKQNGNGMIIVIVQCLVMEFKGVREVSPILGGFHIAYFG